MTTDDEHASYNAFFSYRSPYHAAAERLERTLHAIAKRHDDHDDFRIFLDRSSLKPGPLHDNILGALRRSAYLVVLLDAATADSQWVSDEITYWLETVGSADRLYLVRVDPRANMKWDGDGTIGRFVDSAAIPAPLRDLFRAEPKWIDFTGWTFFGRREDGVPGLCAALMDADPAVFGLVEADNQRRRARIRTVLTAVLAILLVVATTAAVVAVVNQRQAEENATRALAQADSAEALLAAENSPTLAIERALRAASRTDSPTVRSVMLAVAQAARRLTRAVDYPEADTGHPAANARFSGDGTTLMVWGRDRAPSTSRIQAWNIATGAMTASVTVDAADLHYVSLLGDRFVTACSASGPLLVDLAAASTTVLDPSWRAGANRTCDLRQFGGGVVLLGTDGTEGGAAHVVDANGQVRTTEGVTTISAHPSARSAILAGPVGVVVVTPGLEARATTRPGAKTGFADAGGNFLVAWSPQDWGVVTQGPSGPVVRAVALPASAVDVAPVLDIGRMTGELVWITDDGTVGWTGDKNQTRIKNVQGESVWTPYGARLVSLASEAFVAVYRNTAVIVQPPGVVPDGVPHAATDWTQIVVEERIGVPLEGNDSADPVVARCAEHTAVLIATDLPEGGSLLINSRGQVRRLAGRGTFTAGCDAVDISGSLATVPDPGSLLVPGVNEPVTLRATLVADAVAVSPVGDQVAIVKAGFPIEVLSTLPAHELPRPWDVTTGRGGVVTAFGERELFDEGDDLVIADESGVVGRIPLPEVTRIAAARPDGTGAAVALLRPGSDRILIAGDQGVEPAHTACQGPVTYLPGANFAQSLAAAEAQIPVVATEAGFVDCRDGRTVPWEPGLKIVAYDIGRSTGRIVTRTSGATTVTTWTRGDASGLRTVQGPPLSLGDGAVSFDAVGQTAVAYPVGGRQLTLYRRDGDTWTAALSLATGLPGVVDAQVVDTGTLILAVSTEGGFELFDVATGRLVASDPALAASYEPVISGFSARRVGDELFILLDTAGDRAASATIAIPIGVAALERQLCSLYPVEECTG